MGDTVGQSIRGELSCLLLALLFFAFIEKNALAQSVTETDASAGRSDYIAKNSEPESSPSKPNSYPESDAIPGVSPTVSFSPPSAITTSSDPNSAEASPSPSPSASPRKLSNLEILQFQALLIQNQLKIHPSPSYYAELVAVYEKLLGYICMPKLTLTLQYYGPAGNKDCEELIKTVLSFDPTNPTAICAKDGIDTKKCHESYKGTQFDTYVPGTELKDELAVKLLELEAKSAAARNTTLVKKLSDELETLLSASKSDKDPGIDLKVKPLLARLMAITCDPIRLKVPPPNLAPSSAPTASISPDSLSTPTQVPTRVRLFPESCATFIQKGFELYAGFPPSMCHKWGYFSPACVEAKRRERSKPSSADPKSSSSPGAGYDIIGRF